MTNRKQTLRAIAVGATVLGLVAAACGSDDAGGSGDAAACETVDSVSLQLQWFTQAQFAGYYAAADNGFYAAQSLDVEIKEGAVEIVPQA